MSLRKGWILIGKHADTSYPESAVVQTSLLLAKTGHFYADPANPPYTVAPFGPLYYIGVAALARISHLDFWATQYSARVASFLSYLFLAFLAYISARTLRSNRLFALLSASVVLSLPELSGWNATARPDVLALLLSVLAICLMSRIQEDRTTGMLLCGVIGAIAMLIKPTFLAATVAIVIWLCSQRRFRDCGAFCGGFLVISVGVIVLASLAIGPVVTPMLLLRHALRSPSSAAVTAWHAISGAGQYLLLAFGISGVLLAFDSHRNRRMDLLRLYFVFGWIIPGVAMIQCGASANYLLEGLIACALLLPVALQRLREGWCEANDTVRFVLLILVAFAAVQQLRNDLFLFSVGRNFREDGDRKPLERLLVLSDRIDLAVAARQPEFLDPFTNHALEATGHWDPTPIKRRIDAEYYDLVVLTFEPSGRRLTFRGQPFIGNALWESVKARYIRVCQTDGGEDTYSVVLFEPRSRKGAMTPEVFSGILNVPCRTSVTEAQGNAVIGGG